VKNHQLIVLTLEQHNSAYQPLNILSDFIQRLDHLFPELSTQISSQVASTDFLEALIEGNALTNIIKLIALEIQTMAGVNCSFSTTSYYGEKDVYDIVFAYQEEEAGIYAAEAAVRIVKALLHGETYDIDTDIETVKRIAA
jgi:cyanophycin synthetase